MSLKPLQSFVRSLFAALMLITAVSVPVVAAGSPEQYRQGKASAEELYQEGMRLFNAAAPGTDQSEAIGYFSAAGEQGHLPSQVMLGDMYGFGTGVSPSYGQAAYWFIKAAEQGNPKAQLYMGDLYAYGLGVEQNQQAAVRYMQMAADNKSSDEKTRLLARKRLAALSAQGQ